MNKIKKLLVIINILLLGISYLPTSVFAANASLYLTPDSVSQTIGSNFTIYVGENSGGNSVNAFEATVNIPNNLSVTGAGTGGSLCQIWVQAPSVSGQSVSFKCGITGGTTASGNLISISLNARTVGTGTASISGARILAGPGTNVTGGTSGGSYTVTAASSGAGTTPTYGTAAPTVSSSTHPNEDAWYTNTNPEFTWTRGGGTKGFNTVFNQSAGTVPGTTVNTTSMSVKYEGKTDGIYYLHVRASGANGWSSTTHYRVQIDTTAPTGLTVVTEPKVEADKRPMVSFVAVDATSGIDHYEIKMDAEEFKRADSPYTPEKIRSGDHVFTVRAYDKAGNMMEGTAKIKIKQIPIPKITLPANGAILKLTEQLNIKGTADAYTKVDVYFDGVNIARELAVSDDGTWNFEYKHFIMPGKHTIFAVAVKDGIESESSAKVNIRIDASAISILGVIFPTYVVFIVLLVIIVILGAIIIWFFLVVKRKYDKIRERYREKNRLTKLAVDKNLAQLDDQIRHEVQTAYEGKIKTPKEEHQLEGKIEGDVQSATKTVDDVIEKEIKDL